MIIRKAVIADIPSMHDIRLSVKENILNTPGLVTEKDYIEYLADANKGAGWVSLDDDEITGFAVVDLEASNVWALFVKPGCEGKGIGRALHTEMLGWYFATRSTSLWLGTAPGTRAERFYRMAGWADRGIMPNGERKFEMSLESWNKTTQNGFA